MVKIKHVNKAHKKAQQTKNLNHHIKYEYTFDLYRASKYMHKILNKTNPTNQPALIYRKLKNNAIKNNTQLTTKYKKHTITISLNTNKTTINNTPYTVKILERETYNHTSKNKKPTLNYKIWITAKYLHKHTSKPIT